MGERKGICLRFSFQTGTQLSVVPMHQEGGHWVCDKSECDWLRCKFMNRDIRLEGILHVLNGAAKRLVNEPD